MAYKFKFLLSIENLLILLGILIASSLYKFSSIAIAAILILWLKEKRYTYIDKKSLIRTLPILIFFLLYIFSLLYTKDTKNGINEVGQHIVLLILPIIFIGVNFTYNLRNRIKLGFVISSLICVVVVDVYALIDFMVTNERVITINSSNYSKFKSYGLTRLFEDWHPTYVSLSLVLSMFFLKELKELSYKFKAISFIIISLNIVLLNSLIGLFTYICLLLFFIIKSNKNTYILYMAIFSLIIVGLISTFVGNDKIDNLVSMEVKPSDEEEGKNTLNLRLAKWDASIYIIKNNPVLGVSPGDNRNALLNSYIHKKYFFCAEKKFGPHNEYLYILTSFGIVGFLVFLSTIIMPLKMNYSTEMLIFTLCCCVFFLTEDILEREQGLFIWSFWYSIFLHKR